MDKNKEQTPIEKFPTLRKRFEALEELRQAHFDVGNKMLSVSDRNNVTEQVIIAVLKRSLDLLDGITSLVERWNFTAAAPLLRLQLDSLLRLRYLATLKNADAFSTEILKGQSFRDMKDKEGKNLFDARLRDYARQDYPWLDKVYKETSKLIHFSEKHCFISVNSIDDEQSAVTFRLGVGFPNWTESEIASLLDAMGCVTDALLACIDGWTISKQRAYDSQK